MTAPSGAGTSGDARRRLELLPFRALRFDPGRVGDLAAVTCPPYDVVGRDGVARWEAAHPYNVVRLVLPRRAAREGAHAHAARVLHAWRAAGILVQDERPAVYVYEQRLGTALARGLVGAVSLHEPAEAVVLPHEEVFPGPVRDRTELMAAAGAQLEPILLTYEGDGPASDLVDRTVDLPPDLESRSDDGAVHRIWRVSAAHDLRVVSDDLGRRQALIADGHHRYAAYLALRDHPVTGGRPGASHGLALVVDAHRHPLRLGPIHRSVAGLATAEAWRRARAGFHEVRRLGGDEDPLAAVAVARHHGPALAVGDGSAWSVLTRPDPDLVRRALPAERSPAWRELDASLAHELLMKLLWGVVDADQRVDFHHDADEAVARARRGAGVALLLPPPRLGAVLAVAAGGERMPRKSTSFGPKPRTGLLMRLLG